MYRAAATHSDKSNRRNLRVWNNHWQRGHVSDVMSIPDAAFSAVGFCSYTVYIRRTIGLLSGLLVFLCDSSI